MTSTRAARMIAGLGTAGVLAATGVLAGPANADTATPTPLTASYVCNLSGQSFTVPVTLSAVPVVGDYTVGDTIPQVPLTDGSITIPAALEQSLIALAPVLKSAGIDLSTATLGGDITGNSVIGNSTTGTQLVPTSVTVPTQSLGPVLASGTAADLPIDGVTGDLGGSSGTPLSVAGSALPVSLPSTISADLIPAIDPLLGSAPICTTATPAVIGQINVAKAKSKFTSVKLVSKKVSASKKATIKAALANASVNGSSVKPDGTVTAYVGSTKVGHGTLKKGMASFSLTKLKKGVHKVTVKYAGSKSFTAAASKTVTLTVTK